MKNNGNIPNYAANGASNPLNNSALLPHQFCRTYFSESTFHCTFHSYKECAVFHCAINSIIHT